MNIKLKFFLFGFLFCIFLILISIFIYAKVILPNSIQKNLESPTISEIEKDIRLTENIKLLNLNDTTKFTIIDTNKKSVKFINFWESWCAPCIAEFPSIDSLHNDYKSKIDFYIVSQGRNKSTFEKAKKYSLPFYSYNNLPLILKTDFIPRTYIINKDNKIILENNAANWNHPKFRKYLDSIIKIN